MTPHPRPRLVKIAQLERLWLIKKFEDIGVMIHDENSPQLNFVALKLNRHIQFGTQIGLTHVVRTRIDAANRLGATNTCKKIARRRYKCKRVAPLLKS